MKKHTGIILLGLLNIVHGASHLLQVIQSLFLASYSFGNHNHGKLEKVLESPYMGVLWVIVGISTIVLGIRDYQHHKKHKD